MVRTERTAAVVTPAVVYESAQDAAKSKAIEIAPGDEHDTFMLFQGNPVAALVAAQSVISFMSEKCAHLVLDMRGRKYPLVEWWTTVGSGLGLFPVEVSSTRLNRENEIVYESVVEVRRHGSVITRASAIASSKERASWTQNEFSIKSMATTRATGKAYRLPLGWLARLAGLEPTPADEMGDTHELAAEAPVAKASPSRIGQQRDNLPDTGSDVFTPVSAEVASTGEGKFGKWELVLLKTAEGPTFGTLNKGRAQELRDAAEGGVPVRISWQRSKKGGLDCVSVEPAEGSE